LLPSAARGPAGDIEPPERSRPRLRMALTVYLPGLVGGRAFQRAVVVLDVESPGDQCRR